MFDRSHGYLRILGVTAALMIVPGLGNAQVDTSEWVCEYCPFDTGYRADYDLGAGYVSDDAARFGNATGLDEEGAYADVNGTGRYLSNGYRLDWYLEDLGLDSRVLEIEGGRQGSYDFHLGYRELPYRRFDTTETVFSVGSTGVLSLPPAWVPAGTTSGMTALSSSLRDYDIGSDRQIIDVGAGWKPTGSIRLFADYRHEKRDGVDIRTGSSFTQASLLPRWFDFETDRIDLGILYGTKSASLKLAYYGSFFDNQASSLIWDTPFSASAGAEQLQQAQEPDNDFQQVSLSGVWRASVWDTVAAFSVATGSGAQNDTLLPYTINPNIISSALPVSRLNAKVDTGNYALTLTSRPIDRLRLKLAYSYDERDNTTQQYDWNRVITDLFNSGDIEQNTPYDFDRTRMKVSGEFRLFKDLKLSAGYDWTELNREFQEVAEQTEESGWGQLRWRALSWLDVRVRGGASSRDIDRYDTTVAASLGQNPLLRKYTLAYRYREFGELTASISLPDKPVSFGITAYAADDSYSESTLGITDGDELRYTANFSWTISDSASAYVLFGHEEINADQLGSEQFSVADWSAQHEDSFDNVGVGFVWRQPEGKLDLTFDYTRGDGETRILVDSQTGGASQLPDLTSTLDSLRLEAVYRWSDRWATTVNLRYEQFSVEDWSLQDVAPDTLPTILTLGAEPYDYDAWALGVGFRYSFGNRKASLAN